MKNKKLFAILTLVCFMMTLMPVAAFAAVDADTSSIYTVENNPTVRLNGTTADANIIVDLRSANESTTTGAISVWFTEEGKATPSTALKQLEDVVTGTVYTANSIGVVNVATPSANDAEYIATFQRAGVFSVNAAPGTITTLTQVDEASKFNTASTNNKVTVKGSAAAANYVIANGTILATADGYYDTSVPGSVSTFETITPVADGLYSTTVSLTLNKMTGTVATPGKGAAVKGATVKIATNSANIEVSDETVVTNALGVFEFDVTALREGNYEIYVTYGSVEAVIDVQVGASEPDYITVAKAPTTPVSIDAINANDNLNNIVRFLVTDINGNVLTGDKLASVYATEVGAGVTTPGFTVNGFAAEAKYVTVVSKPAGSALRSADVCLDEDTSDDTYVTLKFANDLDVEGTYEFKVALNNGKYATVAIDVKKFTTPVAIELEYAAPAVELGGTVYVKELNFVDANGVRETAVGKVELAASGYAIAYLDTTSAAPLFASVQVKPDEKYLGSEITVNAVSERYGLMTTATLKVVAEAAGLMFVDKTAEVNANNSIQVVLVDAMGNRTALSNADLIGGVGSPADLSYILLDKPEGAKVSVSFPNADNKLTQAGSFKMNVTSNKVGNVKVQVIAKVTNAGVTKYYTGIGEIAFGTGEIGKAVVLSIGSSTMIVDGKAVVLEDTKAIIKNNRTFVPFRALAEAFGAKVDYNAADHSVVATLNGVTVVMPIGSNTYTVNDIVKTADVAAFVDENNRTLVPVKFVANAFGIEVKPIFNDDGTVSDVLFNM